MLKEEFATNGASMIIELGSWVAKHYYSDNDMIASVIDLSEEKVDDQFSKITFLYKNKQN
jgi:hypothetical protein